MTGILIRPAHRDDAEGMAQLLNAIIAKGGTTAHKRTFDAERMTEHYIERPLGLSCVVAEENGEILGFQHLAKPDPSYEGEARLGIGWGIIATFVKLGQHGRGIGHQLFAATRRAADAEGITAIDATIMAENEGGLRFYESLGFRTYRKDEVRISKKYEL